MARNVQKSRTSKPKTNEPKKRGRQNARKHDAKPHSNALVRSTNAQSQRLIKTALAAHISAADIVIASIHHGTSVNGPVLLDSPLSDYGINSPELKQNLRNRINARAGINIQAREALRWSKVRDAVASVAKRL